ncbi:MAG TPA: bifunctional phosphoribosyl-AMP cyclohydrolase/phosphoribosyl-ATP diphosphatase HisIE [Bacteroidales bacterium]|nr:bifunctional phosphoribosyl-AMP cyclohydrolase/phosphoribosyl-ATP diphosphatase HisIE [Bacteroidales bacterium]
MNLNFNNEIGLIPVIIQDFNTLQVLMLGYMNKEALDKTIAEGKVTFYSRSKKRLWTKGETSGNFLFLKELKPDCDNDTILIKAKPSGNTCHKNQKSCFETESNKGFIYKLENIINQRINENKANSYTCKLFNSSINKIIQKVGEEAVELIIEAKDNNDDLFKNEAADLLYHLLLLFKKKNIQLIDIEEVLRLRNK